MLRHEQVSETIAHMITSGALSPGDKVPSLRKMSQDAGVSISTVSQAYINLEHQGVLEARPQSGFYVTEHAVDTPQAPEMKTTAAEPCCIPFRDLYNTIFSLAGRSDIVPLGAAVPSTSLLPVKGLLRATRRIMTEEPERVVSYAFPPGVRELREQIALAYTRMNTKVDVDQIIITTGATEALALGLQTVTRPGDVVAVESPTYFSVLKLMQQLGLMAVEVPTDPETGMDLDALDQIMETSDVKAVITVPNFQNPLGFTMPDENKQRLVEMLTARSVPLLEDDIYGDLHFGDRRPSPCKRFDTKGIVISCGCYSKNIAPGYRVGWVVPGRYYKEVLERLRAALKREVGWVRHMICQHFPSETKVTNPAGGFILWVELPSNVSGRDLFDEALKKNISVTPGVLFSSLRHYRNCIRINCGYDQDTVKEDTFITLGKLVKKLALGK
ncbi:hypothetical protein BOV91_00175 [Solemya velum gill symbiont]|nr:hypothetical protein BOV91_00175 [Solemya velum gill symbiont]